MVVLKCGVPNCPFQTDEVADAVAVALLNNHNLMHTLATTQDATAPACPTGPKLDRPRIDMGVDSETWNAFERRWDNFRRGSGINDTSASLQLFQCAADSLGDALLKAEPDITSRPIAEVMVAMKSLAIIPVSRGVKRAELADMNQSPDEVFRAFAARVRGKAETCTFNIVFTCSCNKVNLVDYTDESIRDVLLKGIADLDIRREAWGVEGTQLPTVNDVVGFVEGREMARNALPNSMNSAISSFKRTSTQRHETTKDRTPTPTDRGKKAPCPDCGRTFLLFSETSRGWNKKAHERCRDCYFVHRRSHRDEKRTVSQPAATNSVEANQDTVSQLSTITSRHDKHVAGKKEATAQPPQVVVLQHHIFSAGEWRRARFTKHPTVKLHISIDKEAPRARHRKPSQVLAEVEGVTDSGAQSDVWSLKEFLAAGFSREDLHPVSLSLQAANKSKISIEGAFFSIIEGRSPDNKSVSARAMIYISKDVHSMFLSHESLLSLGILPSDFPTIGGSNQKHGKHDSASMAAIRVSNAGCAAGMTNDVDCDCPKREDPPMRPSSLPFTCRPENNGKMRDWLLTRYASSTFNTCPHRPLPTMDGPPVEIHLNESASPRACHTAAPIPLHWQDRVTTTCFATKPWVSLSAFPMANQPYGATGWL